MNLESVIKRQAVGLKSTRRDIDIAPDIPQTTLAKWNTKYHSVVDAELSEYILVISYTKTGSFALTGDAMYYDNFMQGGLKVLQYVDVADISAKHGGLVTTDKVYVKLKNGQELCLDGCIDGIHIERFARIFAEIINCAKQQALTRSKQNVPLYQLRDEVKTLYLKILCNYSYLNDNLIDANEYNAISSFAIRMGLESEGRKTLRVYMNTIESRLKTGLIIKTVQEKLRNETGQWDAFRYSLMQDVLYIHNLQNAQQPWQEDGFVGSLMQVLALKPVQMDTMLQAIVLNAEMQQKGADLKSLKTKWKKLVKSVRYSDAYVPAMYLFCSGSIYGISNYTGFMAKDDTSEKAINKQRELILHEIIGNTQKTISLLIEDMNYIAEKLEEAINGGAVLREKYNALLDRLRKAMHKMNVSQQDKEREMEEVKKQEASNRS